MIVVSDTTPLHYLALLGYDSILPALFGKVYIPPVVLHEMLQPQTPESVRAWATSPPPWLAIRSPKVLVDGLALDLGETHALALALELRADAVLMDDGKGRAVARSIGLVPRGTLAVLSAAAERQLLDLIVALNRLQQTNFRVDAQRIEQLRKRETDRRSVGG